MKKKKIVKRKQTGKDKITTKNYRSHTSPPNAPKKHKQRTPEKANPFEGQTGNTENYRRVPKQRLEPCSCGLTMVN